MKRILSLMITLILVFSCLGVGAINASAAAKSVLAFSKKSVEVGDTVTVTVTINADETMYGYTFNLKYDPEILEVKLSSSGQSGGAGNVSVVNSANSKSGSEKITFKALKAGTCFIQTSGAQYSSLEMVDVSVPNQGANLTVKDETLSDNANLKSLSVSDGKLSPSFSASTTSYSVTVGREVTECDIYAAAADSKAKVAVDGGSSLKIGNNTCTVTVTAQSGAQKVYKITIKRTEEATLDTDSSEDETSSETSSIELGSNETQIDGVKYTVAESLGNMEIPLGFAAERIIYNAAEVEVIKDEDENYVIYFLKSEQDEEAEPYLLDSETNSFQKLQYLKQGGRYYIFAENEEKDKFDGFYSTNSDIGGFNVGCFASNKSELSSFSYVYCFNGEEFGYYRYDSVENVLQRYPEMKTAIMTDNDVTEEQEFGDKFSSLSANRKMIVVGCVLLIICFLALVVLLVARAVNHRRSAEYATNLNYTNEFDSIDYDDKFSLESGGFVAASDEVLANLDFGEDESTVEVPEYLLEDEPSEVVELAAEVETELLTEDDSYEEDK